jgi:hypothetical protein
LSSEENVELERLSYLIISKVGPWVLVRYNYLRDRILEEYSRGYGENTVEEDQRLLAEYRHWKQNDVVLRTVRRTDLTISTGRVQNFKNDIPSKS